MVLKMKRTYEKTPDQTPPNAEYDNETQQKSAIQTDGRLSFYSDPSFATLDIATCDEAAKIEFFQAELLRNANYIRQTGEMSHDEIDDLSASTKALIDDEIGISKFKSLLIVAEVAGCVRSIVGNEHPLVTQAHVFLDKYYPGDGISEANKSSRDMYTSAINLTTASRPFDHAFTAGQHADIMTQPGDIYDPLNGTGELISRPDDVINAIIRVCHQKRLKDKLKRDLNDQQVALAQSDEHYEMLVDIDEIDNYVIDDQGTPVVDPDTLEQLRAA